MMTMNRSLLSMLAVGVAVGALGACAMDDTSMSASRWTKPNVTQAQIATDSSQCQNTAMAKRDVPRPDATTGSPLPGGGTTPPVASDPAAERMAFDQCMMGRGYAKIQ